MCWCFIDYWIEKCPVKHWDSVFVFRHSCFRSSFTARRKLRQPKTTGATCYVVIWSLCWALSRERENHSFVVSRFSRRWWLSQSIRRLSTDPSALCKVARSCSNETIHEHQTDRALEKMLVAQLVKESPCETRSVIPRPRNCATSYWTSCNQS